MTASRLAILAALPLLMACGQEGTSPEMTEADGQANAATTQIPDDGGEAGMNQSPDIVDEEFREDTRAIGRLRTMVDHGRRADAASRDEARHPVETLAFFGAEPDMTIVEIWPGGGYYTRILAPFVAEDGKYVAAGFDPAAGEYQAKRAQEFADEFTDTNYAGEITVTAFGPGSYDIAEAGSADMVLTFRNVHNWLMGGFEEEAFMAFYDALRPGGILGVVEHRLPEDADDALEQSSGYVKQSRVIALAEAAGFELAEMSEINANPDDTADHPFGVWTLPPTSRTEDREGNTPEGFDANKYEAIGESDRMTLRFVKPLGADGALLE